MAVIGVLLATEQEFVTFQVTDDVVRTLANLKWSGKARWSTHKRHMGNALTEFTGLEPDEISFKITLLADLGVTPMEELERIWAWERAGTPLALTIGDHNYGRYRWSIISPNIKVQHTDVFGNIYACEVELKLQEYLRR